MERNHSRLLNEDNEPSSEADVAFVVSRPHERHKPVPQIFHTDTSFSIWKPEGIMKSYI